jgi:hypothetical protein
MIAVLAPARRQKARRAEVTRCGYKLLNGFYPNRISEAACCASLSRRPFENDVDKVDKLHS